MAIDFPKPIALTPNFSWVPHRAARTATVSTVSRLVRPFNLAFPFFTYPRIHISTVSRISRNTQHATRNT